MNPISKKELDVILESTHDAMIAVNSEGIVTLFNRAAERLTGIPKEKVLGSRAVEVIPNSRLHIVLATGTPELNQKQSIGTTVILTNRVPVLDERAKVIGAVAVFRDITEIQTLADQISNLWKARSLLEAIIEAAEDAISVADENGVNIIVNSAYSRITGLPRTAVINQPVTVDIAEGESMHLKVLKTGKPVRNERMKVGPSRREVIVNVAPIYLEGEIRGSVGVIRDISEIIALTEELARARKLIRHLEARYTWDDIVGASSAIGHAKEQARRAAETPATVLLRGESGTGKELFAHAIHNASPRHRGQFVRVNCASLAESLLESELFGYEEGAFTGAIKGGKRGLFEEASGGTIFLDEIGEISSPLQSKLLRTLQEKEVVRVGGTRPVSVDVRVIAATNVNLEEKIQAKTFREDLYYRLNVIPIQIPPLRDRKEDLRALAEHVVLKLNREFGRRVQTISDDCMRGIVAYDWPGNVRELENVLGRAMISMRPQESVMGRDHLPPLPIETTSEVGSPPAKAVPLTEALFDAEKKAIWRALDATGGNRARAADLLGISLRSFYYKLARHGIAG